MRLWSVLLPLLAVGGLEAADWPQLQGNPQRTGYTTDSPRPPYGIAWSHNFANDDEKVYAQCQPVVYQDRVYVGTKMGSLYCFRARDGKVLWKGKQAAGPILNAAACADGKVVFSCLDGFVRALDAAAGEPAWGFNGGIHGFNAAPCLADRKVFIGSRQGVFYCLELATGKALWQRDMGSYIQCSAAWNDGRVYFGTEDLVLHCLDAANGNELWKSDRLYGVSFKNLFPVVHGSKVVARTYCNDNTILMPCSVGEIQAARAQGKFVDVPAEVSDAFAESLRARPTQQSLFVFDEKTGRMPYIACHNRGGTNGGVAAAPCVDADGNWYIALAGAWGKGGTGLVFASIDPTAGRFGKYVYAKGNPDEQESFSVGGDRLFVSEQEDGGAGVNCVINLKSAEVIRVGASGSFLGPLGYDAEEAGGHAYAISGDRFYHVAFHILACRKGPVATNAARGRRKSRP
jgi:hypothetical protein